eukprot:XP_014784333.1 PREDICTED: cytochrome P450 3A19-like [Octopus bimaculoides]
MDSSMHKNLLNLMIKAQLKGHETLPPEVEKELHLENVTDWRTKRGITDNEILAQCVLIFLAGYETTASTLTFFTHLMALNPEHQEKLHQEIEDVLGEVSILQLFRNFVADLIQDLRFLANVLKKKGWHLPSKFVRASGDLHHAKQIYSIVETVAKQNCLCGALFINRCFRLDRQCNKACTIKGVKIPEKLTVRIAVDALHYNPKYWPEPEKFIPERFSEEAKSKQVPFTYLPFGEGPRMCLGMRLAKLEFKIAAVEMIRNFKILRCEKTEVSSVFFIVCKR